jgi:hypothetical protein
MDLSDKAWIEEEDNLDSLRSIIIEEEDSVRDKGGIMEAELTKDEVEA